MEQKYILWRENDGTWIAQRVGYMEITQGKTAQSALEGLEGLLLAQADYDEKCGNAFGVDMGETHIDKV